MFRICLILFLMLSMISCSNEINELRSYTILDTNLYLKYLNTPGIKAKKPLLYSLKLTDKLDEKYFDKGVMRSYTYSRLYVLELLYGDKKVADMYINKLKEIYKKKHPDIPKKELDEYFKNFPEKVYEFVRRADKIKRYPEYRFVNQKANCSVPGTKDGKLTEKLLFDENTGFLAILYNNSSNDTLKVKTPLSYLLYVDLVNSDDLPEDVYYNELLYYKNSHSFGWHGESDTNWKSFPCDHELELNPGEFIGRYKYIWEIADWDFIKEGFQRFPKASFFIKLNFSSQDILESDSSIIINYSLFKKMEQLRYKMSHKAQTSDVPEPEEINEDLKKLGHYPDAVIYNDGKWIIPIKPKAIIDFQLFLDHKTGKLYAFMKYNGQVYQSKFTRYKKIRKIKGFYVSQDVNLNKMSLYYTNLNLDNIFAVMDVQNNIEYYPEDYFKYPQHYQNLKKMMCEQEGGMHKDKTPKDRTFTLLPKNILIGSGCYIWDISEWKKLGEFFKKYNKSFYLINLQDFKYIQDLEKFPPGRTLKLDLKLYNEMKKLRKIKF